MTFMPETAIISALKRPLLKNTNNIKHSKMKSKFAIDIGSETNVYLFTFFSLETPIEQSINSKKRNSDLSLSDREQHNL